jgi:AsmA family protein
MDAQTNPPMRNAHSHRDPGSTVVASIVGLLATLIGLIFLWLILFVTKGRFLKHPFERIASRYSERQVRVAGDFNLYLNPLNIQFLADGLTVSNPSWAKNPNFFQSERINTSIATLPLITGRKRFNLLELQQGKVDLAWDPQHKRNTWTFGDPNKKGEPFEMPQIRRALLAGTGIDYRDPQMQLDAHVDVANVSARNTHLQDQIRFTGNGALRGERFTLSGGLLAVNETLAGGRNKLELHIVSGPTTADVTGTMPGVTELEGSDLHVAVRGSNLRYLFDLAGIAVPDTRSYNLASDLTKAGDEWRFTRLRGRFGDSDLAGKMTISLPNERLLVVADLRSNKVDIIDVGPFIGYDPKALDAQGAKGAIKQVNGTPRILPDAPLRIEAISNFDAKVRYHVTTIKARHVPVSNVDLALDLDHSLLKLSPLTFDMAGGHVASDISINARDKPVLTQYDIRMSPTPMGKLLAQFGTDESGTSGTIKARVQMKGKGDTVHESLATSNGRIAVIIPRGTFWTRNIQLIELDAGTFIQKLLQKKLKKPVEINCGLIGFTVRDGIASADPILIDTDKNVILGRGSFSFKDESLDMSVRADAKTFSLFSGQSPVGINGHFAAPGIAPISPELLARAGVGVGLGAATGIGAILAFIDICDAKSAACGPVLEGARAAAMRTAKGQPRKDVGDGTPKKK